MLKAQIYTTKTCAYCNTVKKFLTAKGIEYEVIDADILANREKAYELSGAMTVPITVLGDRVLVGWNPREFMEALT